MSQILEGRDFGIDAPTSERAPRPLSLRLLSFEAIATVILTMATLGFYWWFIQDATFTYAGQKFYTLFDDAMISMRYARNLADGNGLTWTPGQTPVEGYTNPLWTLWMAVLHLAGISEVSISLYVSLSSAVLLTGSALLVSRIARHVYPDEPGIGRVAFFATALYCPLVFWALRGTEVGLVTFLLCAAVLFALRLRREFTIFDIAGLGMSIALGLLNHMEFFVPVVVVGGFAVVWSAGNRIGVALVVAGVVIASLVDLTVFRFLYYGELLPNTYYLKVAGIPLDTRLVRGLAGLGEVHVTHLGIIVAVFAAYLWFRRGRLLSAEALLLLTYLSLCAYSTWLGGDAWDYGFTNRYLTPAVPLLLVIAIRASKHVFSDRISFLRPAPWLPAIVLLVALNVVPVANLTKSGAPHSAGDAAWSAYGLLLHDTTTGDASIAVTWAGGVSYFSRLNSYDELGRTDKVIAKGPNVSEVFRPGHTKWNLQRTIGEFQPDVIAGVYYVSQDDLAYIASMGYEPLAGTCYFKTGTLKVDVERLRAGLQELRAQPRYKDLLCSPEAPGSAKPAALPAAVEQPAPTP